VFWLRGLASIRVHAGDTVTWNINGDELHSVSFTQNADFPPFPASSQAPIGKPGERIPTFAVPCRVAARPI